MNFYQHFLKTSIGFHPNTPNQKSFASDLTGTNEVLQGWDYLEHRFEALKIKRQQCKDRIRAAEALRVAWLKIG